MAKLSFHIFLSLLLSLASLTSAHHHEHSEITSIVDISDSDAHCDLCAMKFVLQSGQISHSFSIASLLPEFVSFEPSFLSPFVFPFSVSLPSRAPPHTLFSFSL